MKIHNVGKSVIHQAQADGLEPAPWGWRPSGAPWEYSRVWMVQVYTVAPRGRVPPPRCGGSAGRPRRRPPPPHSPPTEGLWAPHLGPTGGGGPAPQREAGGGEVHATGSRAAGTRRARLPGWVGQPAAGRPPARQLPKMGERGVACARARALIAAAATSAVCSWRLVGSPGLDLGSAVGCPPPILPRLPPPPRQGQGAGGASTSPPK